MLWLPALSTAVPVNVWLAPWIETVIGLLQEAMPDSASPQLKVTVTFELFQPFTLGAGVRVAVMVGADDAAFAAVQEPFSRWASLIVHAGEPGAGTRMKLARNMLHFTSFVAACEALQLAAAAGISLQDLGNVVRHSDKQTGGAGMVMFRDDAEPLAPDHFLYRPFLHTRALGEKDLGLALALADELDIDLPLARLAMQNLAAGLGVPHSASTAKE